MPSIRLYEPINHSHMDDKQWRNRPDQNSTVSRELNGYLGGYVHI